MNISGIYPVWNFGGNAKRDKKQDKKNEGFKDVLEEEMEKTNEGKVLQVRQGDNHR